MKDMLDRVNEALVIERGTDQQRDLNKAKMFIEAKVRLATPGCDFPEIPNYGIGNTFSGAPLSLVWCEIYRDILVAVRDDLWDWKDVETAANLVTAISHQTKELAFLDTFIRDADNNISSFTQEKKELTSMWDDI